ncbi:aldo/keto reductase [Methanogenium cariaci]|uniref:aldo/keto reductase n=1 Tax=Methanogenium cariaci TaxID=2197 RepID=UPI0007811505|nr:aldo/keto reductase [Methanogenium cariaci]
MMLKKSQRETYAVSHHSKNRGEKLPPALGLGGCMRLLKKSDGKIDEDAAITIIRRAICSGISYIDSAWIYHDGDNERVVGKALEGKWRKKAFLVTKLRHGMSTAVRRWTSI